MKKYVLLIVLPIIFSIYFCDEFEENNLLDVQSKKYHQYDYDIVLSPDTMHVSSQTEGATLETVQQYMEYQVDDVKNGRPRKYTLSTKNESWFALSFNNNIIAGDSQAVNIGNIMVEEESGWLETERIIQNNQFTISWWRQPDTLWLADFEIFKSRRNKLEGEFGAWNRYPSDPTQGAKETDAPGEGYNGGNCLKIEYDVESANPALCGAYFKLDPDSNGTINLSDYHYINIFLKGDAAKGFTRKIQIELKGPEPPDFYSDWTRQKKTRYIITNVDTDWQQCIIPLDDFTDWPGHARLESLEAVHEFTITFADQDVDQNAKEGAIFIDDIFFLESMPYGKTKGCTFIGE